MAASDINLLVISGRMTADPESRGGGKVAAFSIASNRYFRQNGSDETKEEVVFLDCSAFGFEATAVLEKLRKGSPVTLEGRLELNRWQNEAGENRQQIRMVVNRVHSVGLKNGNGNGATTETPAETPEAPAPVEAGVGATPTGDDIPF